MLPLLSYHFSIFQITDRENFLKGAFYLRKSGALADFREQAYRPIKREYPEARLKLDFPNFTEEGDLAVARILWNWVNLGPYYDWSYHIDMVTCSATLKPNDELGVRFHHNRIEVVDPKSDQFNKLLTDSMKYHGGTGWGGFCDRWDGGQPPLLFDGIIDAVCEVFDRILESAYQLDRYYKILAKYWPV